MALLDKSKYISRVVRSDEFDNHESGLGGNEKANCCLVFFMISRRKMKLWISQSKKAKAGMNKGLGIL